MTQPQVPIKTGVLHDVQLQHQLATFSQPWKQFKFSHELVSRLGIDWTEAIGRKLEGTIYQISLYEVFAPEDVSIEN